MLFPISNEFVFNFLNVMKILDLILKIWTGIYQNPFTNLLLKFTGKLVKKNCRQNGNNSVKA